MELFLARQLRTCEQFAWSVDLEFRLAAIE
jgi:hypothetical protein